MNSLRVAVDGVACAAGGPILVGVRLGVARIAAIDSSSAVAGSDMAVHGV